VAGIVGLVVELVTPCVVLDERPGRRFIIMMFFVEIGVVVVSVVAVGVPVAVVAVEAVELPVAVEADARTSKVTVVIDLGTRWGGSGNWS
jgi:hypothetical protein